jgi:hypothetical protein
MLGSYLITLPLAHIWMMPESLPGCLHQWWLPVLDSSRIQIRQLLNGKSLLSVTSRPRLEQLTSQRIRRFAALDAVTAEAGVPCEWRTGADAVQRDQW